MEQQHIQNDISSKAPTAHIEAPSSSISDEINAATREGHAVLNRLIMERIQCALPPKAPDPALYGKGVAAFAQIYSAFEQEWVDIVPVTDLHENDESHEAQLRKWLASLRPAGIERTQRLRADLDHIKETTGTDVDTHSRAQQRIIRKMRRSLHDQPHTLVAFGWVMYMALFSGGRYIRQILRRAGPDFWQALDVPSCEKQVDRFSETPGFSFLSFDDRKDGNEIKMEFKSRLADGEALLDPKERQDIVNAAMGLFDDCIALIEILDREVSGQGTRSGIQWAAGFVAGVFGMVFLSWVGLAYWTAR